MYKKIGLFSVAALALTLVFQNCSSELSSSKSGPSVAPQSPGPSPSATPGPSPQPGPQPAPQPAWQAISTVGAPSFASCPMSVWTGTQMLVIGGKTDTSGMTVHAYNPALNSWAELVSNNAPGNRYHAAVVWTGTDLLLSAGMFAYNAYYYETYRYNPATGNWSQHPQRIGRWGMTGVMAGNRMYSYSGVGSGTGAAVYQDMVYYDVTNNSWGSTTSGPSIRNMASVFAAGNLLFYFGGIERIAWDDPAAMGHTGFDVFDTTTQTWAQLATTSPLTPRSQMASAASSKTAFFFGGLLGNTVYGNGAAYTIANNSWTNLPSQNAPSARRCATGVWTGDSFIVWGGIDSSGVPQANGAILKNWVE